MGFENRAQKKPEFSPKRATEPKIDQPVDSRNDNKHAKNPSRITCERQESEDAFGKAALMGVKRVKTL